MLEENVVDCIMETAKEIKNVATKNLQEEIPYCTSVEDMVFNLEHSIVRLKYYVNSLKRCKEGLMNNIDMLNE